MRKEHSSLFQNCCLWISLNSYTVRKSEYQHFLLSIQNHSRFGTISGFQNKIIYEISKCGSHTTLLIILILLGMVVWGFFSFSLTVLRGGEQNSMQYSR